MLYAALQWLFRSYQTIEYEWRIEQTIETLVFWDAIAPIMASL